MEPPSLEAALAQGADAQREGSFSDATPTMGHTTTQDMESTLSGYISHENARTCALCGCRLGKRHLTPRHHCRICGFSVCDACSPNSVQLPGHQGVHRACSQCLANVEQLPHVREALSRHNVRLHSLVGPAQSPFDSLTASPRQNSYDSLQSTVASYIDILENCEKSVCQVEKKLSSIQDLQGKIQVARVAFLRMAHRLRTLGGSPSPAPGAQTGQIEDAIALCEAALKPLEESQRWRACSMGRRSMSGLSTEDDTPGRHDPDESPRNGALPHAQNAITSSCVPRQSHAPLLVHSDLEASQCAPSGAPSSTARTCCKKLRKCAGMTCAVVMVPAVIVATLAAAAHFWAFPELLRTGAKTSELELLGISVTGVDSDAVTRMRARVTLGDVLPGRITVEAFRAEVSADGNVFAWCDVPDMQANKSASPADLVVDVDAELHITDALRFKSEVARLLHGHPSAALWELTGRPTVKAAGVTTPLDLNKKLRWLPPQQPSGYATPWELVEVDGLELSGGNVTGLWGTANVTYFSPAPLEVHHVGNLTFVLHPVADDTGDVLRNVTVGKIIVPDFHMTPGLNSVDDVEIYLGHGDSAVSAALGQFIGRWSAGARQVLALAGPIEAASPFLVAQDAVEDLPLRTVSIAGMKSPILQSALVSSSHSFQGHSPRTGKACQLGEDCLRGAVVVASNVNIGKAITVRDITIDVNLLEKISYDATLHVLGDSGSDLIGKHIQCDRGHRLAQIFSSAGMWSHVNASRSKESAVQLSGRSKAPTTAFFLPSRPQEGQTDGSKCFGPFLGQGTHEDISPWDVASLANIGNATAFNQDCCFTTILTAAACRQESRDESFIPTVVHGRATLQVGDFSAPVEIPATEVPVTFAEDIPTMRVGVIHLSCSDITFH
mmetsp:Transcript_58780/g.137249  ORF Transcript_58780/g.137249 Transcript_58780/m.137249 type:complete len:895 (-) Transcript_58780:218-2902(-)